MTPPPPNEQVWQMQVSGWVYSAVHPFPLFPSSSRLTCVGRRYFLHAVTWAMTLAWLSLLTLIPFTFIMHWPGWRPAVAATVPGVRQRGRQRRREGCQGQQLLYRTLSCRCMLEQDEKTWAHPKKIIVISSTSCTQNWIEQHSFFFALYLQVCFLFWQLRRSLRGRVWCREEGSCLSGVDEGLWGMWFRP